MTKRDFELIAATLRAARPEEDGTMAFPIVRDRWTSLCADFADRLRAANPRFDGARFLKACGVWA